MPVPTLYSQPEIPTAIFKPRSSGKKRPKPFRRESAGRAEGAGETSRLAASKAFEVRCESRDQRRALIATTGMNAVVAQRIRRNGREQMWDSVIIRCAEEHDNTMAIRVFVSNPDWDELIQIAHIQSRPYDPSSLTALGCNLDHVSKQEAD
jgi:hypothetical protein